MGRKLELYIYDGYAGAYQHNNTKPRRRQLSGSTRTTPTLLPQQHVSVILSEKGAYNNDLELARTARTVDSGDQPSTFVPRLSPRDCRDRFRTLRPPARTPPKPLCLWWSTRRAKGPGCPTACRRLVFPTSSEFIPSTPKSERAFSRQRRDH